MLLTPIKRCMDGAAARRGAQGARGRPGGVPAGARRSGPACRRRAAGKAHPGSPGSGRRQVPERRGTQCAGPRSSAPPGRPSAAPGASAVPAGGVREMGWQPGRALPPGLSLCRWLPAAERLRRRRRLLLIQVQGDRVSLRDRGRRQADGLTSALDGAAGSHRAGAGEGARAAPIPAEVPPHPPLRAAGRGDREGGGLLKGQSEAARVDPGPAGRRRGVASPPLLGQFGTPALHRLGPRLGPARCGCVLGPRGF